MLKIKSLSMPGIFLMVGSLLIGSSCQKALKRVKVLNIPDRISTLRTCGDSLVVVGKNNIMYVWDWKDLNREPRTTKIKTYLKPSAYMTGDLVLETYRVPLEANDIITYETKGRGGMIITEKITETSVIVLRDFVSGREYRRWDLTPYWYLGSLAVSRNGKYVVASIELNRAGPSGADYGRNRLAVISADTPAQLDTYDCEYASRPDSGGHGLGISDDGRLIADVTTYRKGSYIILIDAENKKDIWSKGDKDGVRGSFEDVRFSSDGEMVYATGGGMVYGLEVASGNVLFKGDYGGGFSWPTDCTGLDVSPDGRWLVSGKCAVNTACFCLWDLKTGKRVLRQEIRTGGYSFSHDSKYFATRGPETGDISIYELPALPEDNYDK